jgi:hypothetical protein
MCWLFGCIRFWVDLPHCPIMTPTITYPCDRLWGLKSGTSRNGTGNGQSEPTSAAASKRQGGETNLRRRTQHLTARWAHVGDTLLTWPNTTRHNTTQAHHENKKISPTQPKHEPNTRPDTKTDTTIENKRHEMACWEMNPLSLHMPW